MKITYLFLKGRKKNFEENNIESQEFYYGSFFLKSKGLNVNIIEFDNNLNKYNLLLKGIDKLFSKIFSLPFYTSNVTSLKNFRTIFKTTDLFLISESAGFSILPLLIITKLFKKIKVNLFVMGLYSKHLKFPKLYFFHKLLIKLLIRYVDEVLFLGKGELDKALKMHYKSRKKFKYFPWCVDNEFWITKKPISFEEKEKILFVGNDGNRDSELLIKLAKQLSNFKFIFVTNIPELVNLKLDNVEIIQGQWGRGYLTDKELKKIYTNARLSIIPLRESSQPSGQSVALQSMSIGLPVIISDTKGFWDRDSFFDNENIIFVKSNTFEEWIKKINESYLSFNQLEIISKNARKTALNEYDIHKFNKKILELIEDSNLIV